MWRSMRRGGRSGGVALPSEVLEPRVLLASVSGLVFDDYDGDGTRDAGEPGLPNWVVYDDVNNNGRLDDNPHTEHASHVQEIGDSPAPGLPGPVGGGEVVVADRAGTITDLDVTFTVQHPRDADLNFVLRGPNQFAVRLAGYVGGEGDNFVDTTFDDEAPLAIGEGSAPFTGHYRPLDALSAFDGISPNGHWFLTIQDTVPGNAGTVTDFSITFTTNVPGEPSTTTDAAGGYRLGGLGAGVHRIREVVEPDFMQTAPPGTGAHVVTLVAEEEAAGRDFGNRSGSIAGFAYDDANQDGIRQPTERALPGTVVFLDDNANRAFDVGERSVVTDVEGFYRFVDVAAGQYHVRQALPGGWTQSEPAGDQDQVGLGGPAEARLNFGSYPQIAGTARVVGRHVFYNHSAFDGDDAGASAADDVAVATDKHALLPGQSATFANVTSYNRGINGVMIDVLDLAPQGVTASDFSFRIGNSSDLSTWSNPPIPAPLVAVRRGAGVGGSDRVTVIFADGGFSNTWLEFQILGGARTGLLGVDRFYFGNLVGEVGNAAGSNALTVNSVDLAQVRANQLRTNVPVTDRFDINRDGRVNAVDLGLVRANQLKSIKLITPGAPSGATLAAAPADNRRDDLWSDSPVL